jgi:hypothetical protein
MDQSSFTTSNGGSPQDAPATVDADGRSTEGDESTNSKTSSNASSSSSDNGIIRHNHGDKLEAFIKGDVLRADPAVAEIFYQNIAGKLEYSFPESAESVDESRDLSLNLLDLLEREAFNLVEYSGTPTECAGSSAGPPQSSSGTQRLDSAPKPEQNNSSKCLAVFSVV